MLVITGATVGRASVYREGLERLSQDLLVNTSPFADYRKHMSWTCPGFVER